MGRGRPVVLLHGFGLGRWMWRPQVEALARTGHRVVVPQLLGHGDAPTVGPDVAFDDVVDAVEDLLVELELERPVLCGLSMGAAVALELALRPRMDPLALLLADNSLASGRQRGRHAAQRLRSHTPEEILDGYEPLMFGADTRAARPAVIAEWRTRFAEHDIEQLARVIEAYHGRAHRGDRLREITIPTVVLFGAQDTTAGPDQRQEYLAIPGARPVELAGAGHLSNMEQPEAFTAVLSGLISDSDAPGSDPGASTGGSS
ncbi:alpha/beta fold hydrolase [Euzebya pacifica]|uniref:alpha/beta fold hydrolase n=1 Tax=Euzebya pacifica TaxID=1608957 RepID=UPI0030FCC11C